MNELIEYIERQVEWSMSTFGNGNRTIGICQHIVSELDEIIDVDGEDLIEWIDVIILAIDGACRMGFTPEEIVRALIDKQRINIERKWPRVRHNEPSYHIKE